MALDVNKKIIKKILVLLVLFIFSLSLSLGQQSITVTKTISKNTISQGDILKIDITIRNNNDKTLTGILNDFPPKFTKIIEEKVDLEEETGGSIMDLVKTFQVTIQPGESVIKSYSLDFSNIPDPLLNKKIDLGRSKFIDDKNNQFFSNDINVFVSSDKKLVCNYNFVCDSEENYGNCFQDCLSGLEDNYCDGLKDRRCDPDCREKEDSDCRSNLGYYTLLGFIIILLAVFLFIILRRKKS